MHALYELAKRAQFVDRLAPLRWRVPFRYACQRAVGGLEPEMTLLPDLVDADRLAIDVGGNRGIYTYALTRLCRKVVTFEPIPECARLIAAWADPNLVDVQQCALGETEGKLALHLPRMNGTLITTRASLSRTEGDGVDISVPIRTLDSYGFENVGFIKIDVEGFELATLKGATETLRSSHPKLLIEIDPLLQSTEAFGATFDWLQTFGYRAHFLAAEGLQACNASIQATRSSVYNFVFLPVSAT